MVNKDYCCSSFLAFRLIDNDSINFGKNLEHKIFVDIPENSKVTIFSAHDIDKKINNDFVNYLSKFKKKALLLSGGMDSAILASYMEGCDAYTFRFLNGMYQKEELERAIYYAKKFKMHLHFVDINWEDTVEKYLDLVMKEKKSPVHSIEPQIAQAADQAKKDGNEIIITGSAADDIFGGIDKLLSKDWKYEEFKKRYMYLDPSSVLVNACDMDYAFRKWKKGIDDIDFIGFLDNDKASYPETPLSFQNAFESVKMPFFDPYYNMRLGIPLDLQRIRNGESKYLIRELFKIKYPELDVPEKLPMPRPVDFYFKEWEGPTRKEFKKNIDMSAFNGNQKWLLYCLERFLNLYNL